ncbi:MAG: hypothetical protein MZU91_14575 [Desulfosudis oleivorans]|nr:hypothetical protein [Desulfosudis oleivorans]
MKATKFYETDKLLKDIEASAILEDTRNNIRNAKPVDGSLNKLMSIVK